MNIETILKEHSDWVQSNGAIGVRANLRGANLRHRVLKCALLRKAGLRGADLHGVRRTFR